MSVVIAEAGEFEPSRVSRSPRAGTVSLTATPAAADGAAVEAPARPAMAVVPLSVAGYRRPAAASRAMHDVFDVVHRLAPTSVTVTLLGETGTGKDVTAHMVHAHSPRARNPFVVFDCGAVAANLMESELFGHERGAFTGAHAEHVGAFERAQGGTLFLDEIGELPLELQSRLLRALDTRAVRRVGGARDRHVDVRIIAATNCDLGRLVAAKQFRQDLYFRLAAAIIQLPPLRERVEDLPLLVSRLLDDLGRPDVVVSDDALDALRAHTWPGNVRELKNALSCALAFLDRPLLEARHLRLIAPAHDDASLSGLALAGRTLESVERVAIRQTLLHTRGNKVRAAKTLGIAASTLYEKLKKYGL